MNYVVNVAKGFLPTFYTLKGEKLQRNYVNEYKLGTCMTM